jgi:hypothetical protein
MGACSSKVAATNDDGEVVNTDSGGGGFFSAFKEKEYVDPPMPQIGRIVDFDRLLHRKANVKMALKMMFSVADKDLNVSTNNARNIPVTDMVERVKVTDSVADLIHSTMSKKEDRQIVKDNLLELQKYLSLRKSSLEMMNHNYDDHVVGISENIYVEESRTKLVLKEESHLPDVEEKDDDDDSASVSASELSRSERRSVGNISESAKKY